MISFQLHQARRLLVARGVNRQLQMKDASAMHAQTGHKRIVIGNPQHAIGLSRCEWPMNAHDSRGISQPRS